MNKKFGKRYYQVRLDSRGRYYVDSVQLVEERDWFVGPFTSEAEARLAIKDIQASAPNMSRHPLKSRMVKGDL